MSISFYFLFDLSIKSVAKLLILFLIKNFSDNYFYKSAKKRRAMMIINARLTYNCKVEFILTSTYWRNEMSTPAATAEPITPATFDDIQ